MRFLAASVLVPAFLLGGCNVDGRRSASPQLARVQAAPSETAASDPVLVVDGYGITPAGKRLSDEYLARGRDGVDELLALIEDSDEQTQALVAYTLQRSPDLWWEDVERISQIGDPAALIVERISFSVVAEQRLRLALDLEEVSHFVYRSSTKELEDAKAEVLRLFDCRSGGCNDEMFRHLEERLVLLGPRARPLLDDLVRIAGERDRSALARAGALRVIGAFGDHSAPHIAVLEAMRDDDEADVVASELRRTLSILGGRVGAKLALDDLRGAKAPSERVAILQSIERMGPRAATIVSELLPYATSRQPDVRLHATQALAATGDARARSTLENALFDVDDWERVMSAIDGLARLGSPESVGAVRRLQRGHWYSAVRARAKHALALLGGSVVDELHLEGAIHRRFPLVRPLSPYRRGDGGIFVPGPVGPMHAVVLGGTLRGRNHGEFGGGLVFEGEGSGAPVPVFDDNVLGIYEHDGLVTVASGLTHMTLQLGNLRVLRRRENGSWHVDSFHRLPATPFEIQVLDGGELHIHMIAAELIFSPSTGRLRELAPVRVD